jgi:hypothetical protein
MRIPMDLSGSFFSRGAVLRGLLIEKKLHFRVESAIHNK